MAATNDNVSQAATTAAPFVTNTNLHVTATNDIGAPIAGITTDYDGTTRSATTPDAGAHEFTPAGCTGAVGGTATGSVANCGPVTSPTIGATGYSTGIGSGYQWMSSTVVADYPASGTPVGGQTNPATLTTGLISTTTYYWLKVTCPSGTLTAYSNMVTVTINAVPTATVGNGAGTFCTSALITATGGTGGTIYFQGTTTGGTSTATPSSSQTVTSSGTYYFRSFNGNCWGAEGSVTVVIQTPAGITGTPASICVGASGTISASASNCGGWFNSGTAIPGSWSASSPSADRPTSSTNSATCGFASATPRNYHTVNFQVSVSGSYSFEMDNNAAYDGMGYLVSGAFVPGSCASGTFIKGDDDSGVTDNEPLFTANLVTGVTYTLISTNWDTPVLVGTFNWTVTPPSGGQIMFGSDPGTIQWYTAASGGSPIGTGSPFNPVGVAGSGLANTNTAGTTTYYAACSLSSTCRTPVNFVINNCASIVNLKLFIEGYYTGGSTMAPVKNNQDGVSPLTDVEALTVELHSASAPYATLHTTTAMLKTNGNAVATFASAPTGSFYIAVSNSNAIKTWSKTPQTVGGTTSYDFSTAATQAYGDNLTHLGGGVYGFYSGDINQDGSIDGSDAPDLFNAVDNSDFGVQITDLNGDGSVDNSDIPLLLNNSDLSIYSHDPNNP